MSNVTYQPVNHQTCKCSSLPPPTSGCPDTSFIHSRCFTMSETSTAQYGLAERNISGLRRAGAVNAERGRLLPPRAGILLPGRYTKPCLFPIFKVKLKNSMHT